MVLKVRGILEFSPEDISKKHETQSIWKRVAIIKTNCDLDRYYAWFLSKRFGLELNKNIRGSHVTFISDRLDKSIFDEASKVFNGKEIDFYIELNPMSNGKHWWLRAYSPDAESIRESLGLSRDPYFGLHFTLGYVNDKNLDHSKYILASRKLFEDIDARKSLNEHEIRS